MGFVPADRRHDGRWCTGSCAVHANYGACPVPAIPFSLVFRRTGQCGTRYSYLKDVAGFVLAALSVWNETVRRAIKATAEPGTANVHQDRGMR